MKVICTQENLKNGLLTVGRIISSSNTLPILNNVLLKIENGLLNLSATNLELAIITTVRCKVEQEGSLCLPAKTFSDLVNNLPSTNITIETTSDAEAAVSTDHYSTKIKTLPSEDFPLIPTVDNGQKITLSALDIKQAVDSVVFAASTSETQPEISGIFVAAQNGKQKLVATDRYRLAEKTLATPASITKNIIIPHKTALELSRILTTQTGPVEAVVTDNQMAITAGDTQMISRLIDGQYPDYQQIIPENFVSTLSVARTELVNALKTSGIFSRGTGSVVIKYNSEQQQMKVNAVSHDVGESSVELAAEISGESGSIVLNYKYVLDALTVMAVDTVVIKVAGESAPVIFQPLGDSSYIYLVMPIKS
jgi:DNA polymerase III subunit beta